MSFDPAFYQDSVNSDILHEMDQRYQKDIYLQQQFWVQADIDLRFKAGDQSLWPELYGMTPSAAEKQFNFNRIRRIVNLIVGHQRRNRKSLSIIGQESGDEHTSDQLSGVLQWVMSSCNGYHTISSAFESAITTGFSLLCPWIDYREDPISGDIKLDKLDFNSFMIDPAFKQTDLSDAAYIWTRRFVSKQQAKLVFPGRDKDIENMPFTKSRDGKFTFMQQNITFQQSDIAPLDWYWYSDTKKATFVHDEETGECIEWGGDDDALEDFLGVYPHLSAIESFKPTVKLAVALNGVLMYDGPSPFGIDVYPFVGCFGYFEPNIPYYWWKIQGVVRGLRDAQYLFNRKKRIELSILESQINSGLKVKEDALVNEADAFLSGEGRVLFVKKTASLEDVQTIPAPGIDQSMMMLTQSLAQEMLEISGVNEELLGAADDEKAGILAKLRQGAGLTTLQTLFDQLDLSCQYLGNVLVKMIQANFSPGKIKRILGQEPSPRFADKAFGKYDIQVEEGIMTSTQKQMQFAQLLHLKEIGIPIPDDILVDSAVIQKKSELVESLKKQNEQSQQMQQAQEQQQLQSQQVLAETLLAKADSDHALAAERMSKIRSDKAANLEKITQSQENRASASLDRAKAIKELTDIDLSQMQRAIEILASLREIQEEKEEADEQKINRQDQSQTNQMPGIEQNQINQDAQATEFEESQDQGNEGLME